MEREVFITKIADLQHLYCEMIAMNQVRVLLQLLIFIPPMDALPMF